MLEFLIWFVPAVDDVSHVGSQNEWCPIPFKITKHLCVTKKFAKINMEEMAGGFDHNIIVMSIANTKDISRHAIAGTRSRKIVHCSFVLEWRRIVLSQPVSNRSILKRAR